MGSVRIRYVLKTSVVHVDVAERAEQPILSAESPSNGVFPKISAPLFAAKEMFLYPKLLAGLLIRLLRVVQAYDHV